MNGCKIAKEIGVDVVRINALMRERENFKLEDYINVSVDAIKKTLDKTKDLNVSLAMENHGVIANRREFVRNLISTVNSDLFGLTFDTGNFYWYGYPINEVYEILKEFAKYVKHTHMKNAVVPAALKNTMRKPTEVTMAPLYEGDVDMKLVINTLKNSGYDGDITIEDESMGRFTSEERIEILKKDVEYLKLLI